MYKIIHIIPQLNRGGAETLLLKIVTGLQRDGNFLNKVVIIGNKRSLDQEFLESDIEIDYLKLTFRSLLKQFLHLRRIFKLYKPDLVHSHLLEADRIALISAYSCGIRNRICTLHNCEPAYSLKSVFGHMLIWLSATKMIAVSKAVQKHHATKKWFPYPMSKIHVIYNCPSFFITYPNPKKLYQDSQIKIIHIGKYHPQKGHIYSFDAIKQLVTKGIDVCFDCYGPDIIGYKEKLHAYVQSKELDNYVTLNNESTHIHSIMEKADLLIASSLWEGLHMVVIEAMVVGLPVILTKLPPHMELLPVANYPLYVSPKSGAEISDKIEFLLKDPKQYEQISRDLIENAKRFSPQKMVENHISLYLNLLQTT